jgi:exosome complex exonuclease DIS3/RRP44
VAVEIIDDCLPYINIDEKQNIVDSNFREIEGIQTENIVNGKVVGIIRRNFKQFSGSIDMSSTELRNGEDDDRCVKFVPLDKRIPFIWISTRRLSQIYNSRLLVAVDNWSPTSSLPVGHIVQVLGDKGNKEVETKILLMEFGVATDDFSPAVMSCLPPKDWQITPDIVSRRTDFRKIPIVSIDPPGCKDIDDALHCAKLPNGRYQVGVHIAGKLRELNQRLL